MHIDNLYVIPVRDNIQEYADLAKKYNCGFEYNDFFLPSVLDDDNLIEEIISDYKEKEARYGFVGNKTLHGAFLDVTIFSDDPAIKNASDMRVEQSLQIAERIGAKSVVFHTNYIPNFLLKSYRDNWVSRNVAYYTEKARKYPNINLYMENMFDTDWGLISKFGEATKDIDNLGICFDYAHAFAFGDEAEIKYWVKSLAPYVKHIHINDNDFKSDLHLAVGDGSIDWEQFKSFYEEYMPEASVLIETTGIEKTLKSLEFINKL